MSRTPAKMGAVEAINDTTPYPRGVVNINGKPSEIIPFFPYGFCANPPLESLGINLASTGSDGVKWFFSDDFTNRFRNLLPGEVQVGNYELQNYIKFDNIGKITIRTGNTIVEMFKSGDVTVTTPTNLTATAGGTININAPLVNINGDVNITGNLNVTGNDFEHNGTNVGDDHRHSNVEPGSGNSGNPI